MLPETLLCLISATIVLAQSRQQLSLNTLSSWNAQNLPNPPTFTLPVSQSLSVSIALCSGTSSARFFVTNSSSIDTPGSDGGTYVYELVVTNGHANFTGVFTDGGVLAVEEAGQSSFEVGVSDTGPMHEILDTFPLLGDTTANQVLLFSPPFSPLTSEDPSYPNYTLPIANTSAPSPPSSPPSFSLTISPTSSSLTSLPQTGCALKAQTSTGTVINETLWPRDASGWRNQWVVNGLFPLTNYTAYVVEDGTKVSGPLYFVTKSASFSCSLVASLPYCPGIAYSVPIPPPPPSSNFYDAALLPSSISEPIISSLTNFTTTLTTFACGRDMYSPLVTCADCQRAYRQWLCAISFTRCSEARPGDASSSSSTNAGSDAQQVFSALSAQASSAVPRNSNLPTFNNAYTALLPCLETCNAVDRACPAFLGFQCPIVRFNAADSYGVGYVDRAEDAAEGMGTTKTPQDRWGNVWCNSG